ncbi:MAG: hypothetical protein KKC68_04580 [Candidatus Thermoplasmatota archaeon]|nr:hypothetical protein [Candidatus Thermoplasmatota archaeon]MBU1941027.1 hypothetical protein [Candidatus Thermoplasmatota archaeon]
MTTKLQLLKQDGKEILKSSVHTTLTLLKILIPISIVVKILAEYGVIGIVGQYLSPLMGVIGLPGETGLVWATAMITNLYGALIVFFTLTTTQVFTVGQITILAGILLIAHTLPIELRIAQKAGASLMFMFFLRVFAAFVFGWILYQIFSVTQIFDEPGTILWEPGPLDPTLLGWVLGELRNYLMIFLIITGLIVLMHVLRRTGAIEKINNAMEPLLEFMGMSKAAAPITIIGTTLGLAYGGALIINEAKSGKLTDKDVVLSLSLMGLSHSLIEDTLIMLAIGASIIGVLFARILFTIILMILLVQLVNRVSEKLFKKLFITKIKF